jgi:hypothetical protein
MFSLKSREIAKIQISELIMIRYFDYKRQNGNYRHGDSANLRGHGNKFYSSTLKMKAAGSSEMSVRI